MIQSTSRAGQMPDARCSRQPDLKKVRLCLRRVAKSRTERILSPLEKPRTRNRLQQLLLAARSDGQLKTKGATHIISAVVGRHYGNGLNCC